MTKMTAETKKLVLQGLGRLRGDDHLRARAAFRGMTPEQMKAQHGQSGRTRQQVLDDYEAWAAAVDRAESEVMAL